MNKQVTRAVRWLADELPKYWKAAIAWSPVVLFVGTEVVQAIENGAQDGSLTRDDLYRIVVAGVVAYGVYKKANRGAGPAST